MKRNSKIRSSPGEKSWSPRLFAKFTFFKTSLWSSSEKWWMLYFAMLQFLFFSEKKRAPNKSGFIFLFHELVHCSYNQNVVKYKVNLLSSFLVFFEINLYPHSHLPSLFAIKCCFPFKWIHLKWPFARTNYPQKPFFFFFLKELLNSTPWEPIGPTRRESILDVLCVWLVEIADSLGFVRNSAADITGCPSFL